MHSWTKGQHVEHGTWWDREGDPPQEVLDARARHGFNPDGSYVEDCVPVVYRGRLYDVSRSALRNPRPYGHTDLDVNGPKASGDGQADDYDKVADDTTLSYDEQRLDQLRAEVTRRNTKRAAEGRSQISLTGTKPELVARLVTDDAETKRLENRQ